MTARGRALLAAGALLAACGVAARARPAPYGVTSVESSSAAARGGASDEGAGSAQAGTEPSQPGGGPGSYGAREGGVGTGQVSPPPAAGPRPSGGGSGAAAPAGSGEPVRAQASPAVPRTAAALPAREGSNTSISEAVLKRAAQVAAEINGSGGYRLDGRNDCWGFVRREWDPFLGQWKLPALPVSDYRSRQWAPITDWSRLKPGDVLATHQGHKWGTDWHGGMFFSMVKGAPSVFDNSYGRGARPRPAPAGLFRYYYIPTHQHLAPPASNK